MLPRTLSAVVCLLFFFKLNLGELFITTKQDVLKDFLNNPDTLRCALLKHKGINDSLENIVSVLSFHPKFKKNIAGAIHLNKNDQTSNASINIQAQLDRPAELQCFIGHGISSAISSPQSETKVSKWMTLLKKQVKQMWNLDRNQLKVLKSQNNVVLLALPTLAQMSTFYDIVKQVKETLSKSYSVATALIHPDSVNSSPLRASANLPLHQPVFAVFSNLNNKKYGTLIFKEKDVIADKIIVESFAQLSQIRHLSIADFHWEAMTVKKSERFRPYIVLFYAWWAEHAESYLRLIKTSVDEIQKFSVRARFALVNVAQEKTVMSRHLDVRYFKKLPFIAVFQREKGKDTVNQTVIHESHPSPFYLCRALREHGIWLYDAWDKLWDYAPYLSLDYTNYCDIQEGPRGSLCTAWASNLTDDRATEVKLHQKQKSKIRSVPYMQMAEINGMPVLTQALWDAVIEKSQISYDNLNLGSDIFVSVIVFIKEGCGSCNKKMPMFQEVHKEIRNKGNANLFLVNCSIDASLCEDLGIKGFPTVSAFRSFAALATLRCFIHPPEKPYMRRDYHGPLSTGDLIPWIESLTLNSVSSVGFTDLGDPLDMIDDVRLVATVVPKFSNYLPIAPGGERNYFYSPRCLRLACESLFGLASCYIVNSREIPEREFAKASPGKTGMVITEVAFERRDGIALSLMKLGKSMLRLIEQETLTDLHLFHSAHQYSLGPKQTCEEDHDLCTQTIVSFVRDHLRLPVTQLTSEIFHTKNNPVFESNKPVLIALSHSQNLTRTSSFMKFLQSVARRLYHNITVTALDADQFPAWAGSFVPYHYPTLFVDSADGGPLHEYPRICLVTWNDHKNAAFYPPLKDVFNQTILKQLKLIKVDKITVKSTQSVEEAQEEEESVAQTEEDDWPKKKDAVSMQVWDEDSLVDYVEAYLEKPDEYLVQTQPF